MDYKTVYQRLFEASKQAGIVATMMQKDIINEEKKVLEIEGENSYHRHMREAKTRSDEIVQEILLASLLPEYEAELTLDVEEETPLQKTFTNTSYQTTLVIDPIDGTLDYIQQKDTYSICSALIHEHDIKTALVYFPVRKIAYGYCEGMTTMLYHDVLHSKWDQGEILDCQPFIHTPKRIYKNARLADTVVKKLLSSGFEVVDDQEHHLGCPDAIRACMYGEALAYFSDTRNLRDILMGAILSKMKHGHCFTYKGEEVQWESHGRQKEIVFSIYEKKDIFK